MDHSPVSQWLGGPYQIVLKEPAGEQVVGILRSLVPEQHLTLDQATIVGTGQTFARLDIRAIDVSDIIPLSVEHASPKPPSPEKQSGVAFQDPAIVSMSRKPKSATTHNSNDKTNYPNPADRLTYSSPDETDTTAAMPLETSLASLSVAPPASTTVVDTTEDETQHLTPTTATARSGTTPRERRRGKRGKRQQQPDEGTQASSALPTNQGKGWRQTPILQSTKSFQPFASLKKPRKGRADPNADNGWASEDVTDVQGAGDFDFEGGLAKFDKRTIFNEMREQDLVDENDRLVSHNRLPRPKPGTAGGKNLHYTENVLDLPSTLPKVNKELSAGYWRSDADDGGIDGANEVHSGREGSGRTSRLRGERGESRMSTTRRSQSRKASATASIGGPSRVNSGVSLVPSRGPRAGRVAADLPQPSGPSVSVLKGLYTTTNRRIETVTHLQMLVVENVASNELGLTEDLMSENAGRGISEVALRALDDPATRLRVAAISPPVTPTIVVLAGNHKSGARAVAAARHLRNRNVHTLVCVVGIERERELLDDLRRQVRLFRNFGGAVYTKSELFEHLVQSTDSLSSSSQVGVTLIIDALLGLTISFEELRKSDQATSYELMEWSNRNEAFVIAIDVPSGIEPSSGKVNVIDGSKLYVEPRYVVALGAPKQGLLNALESVDEPGGILTADEWKIYLADIGLGTPVWRKAAATKLRRGIDFDNKWVLELKHQVHLEHDE